jgi:hypothetical protein
MKPLAVPAEYLPLHKYLDGRYADTVVLTLSEIEDLVGFALPDVAHREEAWWSNTEAERAPCPQCRSWTRASRTAKPNLPARIVTFERI